MITEKKGDRFWVVKENGVYLAGICLDYFCQISEIIFRTADPDLRRAIKQLAVWHVVQFQVCRSSPIGDSVLNSTLKGLRLTGEDSDALMRFEIVPERVKNLETRELDKYLARANVCLVEGDYPSMTYVLLKATEYIERAHGIKLMYSATRSTLGGMNFDLTFRITGDQMFCVWKSVNTPNKHYDSSSSSWLHICPSYHPCFTGAESVGLINGDTDAFIGRHNLGIDSITSPQESRTSEKQLLSATWSHVNHPFYCEGRTLGMRVSFARLLSEQSYQLLLSILLGALNLENKYLEVSGGFRSPYPYPQRPRGNGVRGSENSVVWEYRTLVAEGRLRGSIVPSWFERERWLDAYPEQMEVSR